MAPMATTPNTRASHGTAFVRIRGRFVKTFGLPRVIVRPRPGLEVRASAAVPPASRSDQLADLVPRATALIAAWEARFGPYEPAAAGAPAPDRLAAAWDAFGERMADHYPFFHPRYAGQMLKPPHPVAVAGYLAAMLVNPNNHALDGGRGRADSRWRSSISCGSCSGCPPPGWAT